MIRLLHEQQNKPRKDGKKKIHQQIVHNYLTYTLSGEQYKALSFGLDTHIPVKGNKNHTHVKKVGHTSEFIFDIY